MKKILLICLITLFSAATVSAATITSTQSGNWNSGSTWDSGVVPTNADDVIIATGHTVNVIKTSGVA